MTILSRLEDEIFSLARSTSILSLIQTATAEGSSAISYEDMSNALYEIVLQQERNTDRLRKIYSEVWEELHKNN